MRRGVRLGVDVGQVRVGVASCDPDGLVATPVETVQRGAGDLQRLRELAEELGVMEVLVGLPRSLAGRETASTLMAREFAGGIAAVVTPLGIPVRLVDERLSTVTAEGQLRARGRKGKSRRAVVDQAAAVVILQNALDAERASGRVPGETVTTPALDGPPAPSSGRTEDREEA